MELEGLEPSTFRLPAERSGQLSYSPGQGSRLTKDQPTATWGASPQS